MLILKKGIKVYDEIIKLQLLKHHIIEQKSLLLSCQNSKENKSKAIAKQKQYRNSRAAVAKIVSDASNNANRKNDFNANRKYKRYNIPIVPFKNDFNRLCECAYES